MNSDFEGYLAEIKTLSTQSDHDVGSRDRLLDIISRYSEKTAANSSSAEFFRGERDFYTKQYKQALKHYLEATDVNHYEFYCYRASAFIAKAQGLQDKALTFAKKALMKYPEDGQLLKLMETLGKSSHEEFKPKVSLGEQELEELAGIFESHAAVEPSHVESNMNTDASVFSFPKGQDPAMTAALTQRLYPMAEENSPFIASNPVEELKMQMTSPHHEETSLRFSKVNELERRISAFQLAREKRLIHYRDQVKQRPLLPDHFLYVLSGYQAADQSACAPFALQEFQVEGGYFLRWNQRGIVINPGKSFLHNFHRLGLHLRDIHEVIITQDHPDAYAEVQDIYELNYQLNRSSPQDLQIIHYYIHQGVYQTLSAKLKPRFKQERHTIHSLDLFPDSPDVEKMDLGHGIALSYFPTSALEALAQSQGGATERAPKTLSSLGLLLELSVPEENRCVRIGYLSGASWSPLLGHHLGQCDILIAGFGHTHPQDYEKMSYIEGSLGYFGSYSLIEELAPCLTLCTEFSGLEGDIALEVVKKLRDELSNKLSHHQTILPGSMGLFLDLRHLKIRCTFTGNLTDPSRLRTVRSGHAFGKLHYLDSASFI